MGLADVVFRTNDGSRWGNGTTQKLSKTQLDLNFWELRQAIIRLTNNPPRAAEVVGAIKDGANLSFVRSDGTSLDPIELPVLRMRPRGEWQPTTSYLNFDWFTVAGRGIFVVLQDHISDTIFDPLALLNSEPLYWVVFDLQTLSLTSIGGVQITGVLDGDTLTYDAALQLFVNTRPGAIKRVKRSPIEGQMIVANDGEVATQLIPGGSLTTMSLQLPSTPKDLDVYELGSTEQIAQITVTAADNDVTVMGSVFLLAANTGASWWYSEADLTWYRRW